MDKHIVRAFPTILLESTDSDFVCKNDLIKWVYSLKESDPEGIKLSNCRGWQSSKGDFFKTDKSFRPFIEYISQRIGHLVEDVFNRSLELTDLWINVNTPGSYNLSHNHPQSDIAGCLWVEGPENSGNIILKNPNGYVDFNIIDATDYTAQLSSHVVIHTPIPGKMLLFPAHIMHSVEENLSQQDRISIAFNLSFV